MGKRLRRRASSQYQHDPDDRRAVGVDHYLHGHHASTPKGLEALVPQPAPPNQQQNVPINAPS
jgi:hypothetical protein